MLSDLSPGERARLVQLRGERAFRRRLMELGFLPGATLRLVRRAGVGQLIEVELRRSHVSLRLSEARGIHVEPCR